MSNIIGVSEGKIALYSMPNSNVYIDVVFKDETFWMTQKSMTELFDVNAPAISKHLKNIFEEEELNPGSTISKMEIVQNEGGREVSCIFELCQHTINNNAECLTINSVGQRPTYHNEIELISPERALSS